MKKEWSGRTSHDRFECRDVSPTRNLRCPERVRMRLATPTIRNRIAGKCPADGPGHDRTEALKSELQFEASE